ELDREGKRGTLGLAPKGNERSLRTASTAPRDGDVCSPRCSAFVSPEAFSRLLPNDVHASNRRLDAVSRLRVRCFLAGYARRRARDARRISSGRGRTMCPFRAGTLALRSLGR